MMPFSRRTADAGYARSFTRALARAGLDVTVLGLADAENPPPSIPAGEPSPRWAPVSAGRRSDAVALLSRLPLEAGRYATRPYRRALRHALQDDWGAIFLDHYCGVWTLDEIDRAYRGRRRPILVHVSHDFSTRLTRQIAQNFAGDPLRRLALVANAIKTRRAEKRLMADCDLVICHTREDEAAFVAAGPPRASIVVRPGYDRVRVEAREITADTPRRVVILGSFQWIAKQMNLEAFLTVADPLFADAKIDLHIVGEVPASFQKIWRPRLRATTFCGFVDSIEAEMAAARMGLIAETTGGGFKNKLLDYGFMRVPIAAIESSIAGLPDAFRDACILARDEQGLAQAVVAAIDDLARLNRNQEQVYAAAQRQFDWDENGRRVSQALRELEAKVR